MNSESNWKKTALLSLVLASLGSFAYWLEYTHKPQLAEQEQKEKKLFSIDKASVEKIGLQSGASAYAFVCNDLDKSLCKSGDQSSWSMTQPSGYLADDTNVNTMLSTLAGLSSNDSISLSDETPEKRKTMLTEYGLSEEQRKSGLTRKLSAKTKTGESVVYVGNTHPIGDKVYVLVERDGKLDEAKVQLVSFFFKSLFDHDLTYWRNKRIAPIASHEISEFEIKNAREHFAVRKKDAFWEISDLNKPKEDPLAGDQESIDAYLSTLAFLSAKSFLSEDKSSPEGKKILAGTKTTGAITYKVSGNPKVPDHVTVTLLEKKNGKEVLDLMTTSTLPSVMEMEKEIKPKLDKHMSDFRFSHLILSLDRYGAKNITVASKSLGEAPLVLVNDGGKWWFGADKKEEASGDQVQRVVDKLGSTKVAQFVKDVPNETADATEFTFTNDKGVITRHFKVWKKGGDLFARDLLSKRKESFRLDTVLNSILPLERSKFAITPKEKPAGNAKPPQTSTL